MQLYDRCLNCVFADIIVLLPLLLLLLVVVDAGGLPGQRQPRLTCTSPIQLQPGGNPPERQMQVRHTACLSVPTRLYVLNQKKKKE